jgi:hypothetical protein
MEGVFVFLNKHALQHIAGVTQQKLVVYIVSYTT